MPTRHQSTRTALIAAHGRNCFYCGKGPLYKRALHVSLETPVHLGGKDEFANLRLACSQCNERKADKPLLEYVEARLADLAREQAVLGQFLACAPHR